MEASQPEEGQRTVLKRAMKRRRWRDDGLETCEMPCDPPDPTLPMNDEDVFMDRTPGRWIDGQTEKTRTLPLLAVVFSTCFVMASAGALLMTLQEDEG